jgi:hypothetical protein
MSQPVLDTDLWCRRHRQEEGRGPAGVRKADEPRGRISRRPVATAPQIGIEN